jgi:molybdate transport repressor ModE-like protein
MKNTMKKKSGPLSPGIRLFVRKTRGGSAGGSTELTEFGRELLEGWQKYREAVMKGMDGAFEQYLSGLLERSEDEC